MGSVGYYLALTSPEPQLEHTGAFGIERPEPIAEESLQREGAAEFRYKPGKRRDLQLAIEQSHRQGDAEMLTRIDLGLTEARRQPSEGAGVKFVREYQRVGVSIRENGEPVDSQIAAQIESLLVGTRAVSTVDGIGKPTAYDWRSVTNPQVRKTLYILRHATQLLTPHFRRDAVNPGDSWTYRLPADAAGGGRFVESIEGDVEARATFVGTVERKGRRLAVIERSLNISGSGEIQLEDEPGTRWFELTGEGSGRLLFDIEQGAIVQSRLIVDRTLELQGDDEARVRKGEIELFMREAPESSG